MEELYIAIIHKDRGSDFGVSFPDFPGCVTASVTVGEVFSMAKEALAGHIETMIENGFEIPPPPADPSLPYRVTQNTATARRSLCRWLKLIDPVF